MINKLKDPWVHYTHGHASGDNSTITRIASGKDRVTEFSGDSRIVAPLDADKKDKFRHRITLRVKTSS